jgi:hypothetical protein
MPIVLLTVALIICVPALLWAAVRYGVLARRMQARRLPEKRARFAGREPLGAGEIYARFYGHESFARKPFEELWQKMAESLKLDASLLRPTDRFDTELAPVKGHMVEDEMIDLEELAIRELKRSGRSATLLKALAPKDIDGLVRLLLQRDSAAGSAQASIDANPSPGR